jgi:hypothetical protein
VTRTRRAWRHFFARRFPEPTAPVKLGLATYGLGLLAGALSILSPCVLPLVPVLAAAAMAAHRFGPLALGVGLAMSFTVVGLAVATLGASLGLDPDTFRTVGALQPPHPVRRSSEIPRARPQSPMGSPLGRSSHRLRELQLSPSGSVWPSWVPGLGAIGPDRPAAQAMSTLLLLNGGYCESRPTAAGTMRSFPAYKLFQHRDYSRPERHARPKVFVASSAHRTHGSS